MKHQTVRDRLNEGEGMVRSEMKHKSHGRMDSGGVRHGHAMYRNEVEEPSLPPMGHRPREAGLMDAKGEAMDIAYGQAGREGCMSDEKKIHAQFKDYHWDGESMNTGY